MVNGNWSAISQIVCRSGWLGLSWAFPFMALLALALGSGPATAGDGEPLVRELLVPFEDLHVVLKEGGRRVFLNRDEYEQLLAKASVSEEEQAPQAVSVVAADYAGSLDGQRAMVQGRILVDVTASGLHTVDLPFVGVGVMSATLDGRPAPLSRPDDGCAKLFVEGRGRHELILDLVVPAQVSAAQQTLGLQLPRAGAGRFRLSVDGDVDLKSGVAV